jgi:putative tryptophan/tyrosine transport system substrate-binding protein
MIRKLSFWLVTTTVLMTVANVEAQQSAKIHRIGILELASPAASASQLKAFQQGLRELGYLEGKNIILEYRYADGKLDRLPELAAELVGSKVDAIVTRSTGSIRAAMNASKTIPIILPPQARRSRTDSLQAWRDPAVTSLD